MVFAPLAGSARPSLFKRFVPLLITDHWLLITSTFQSRGHTDLLLYLPPPGGLPFGLPGFLPFSAFYVPYSHFCQVEAGARGEGGGKAQDAGCL